jgi:hypothetical protein
MIAEQFEQAGISFGRLTSLSRAIDVASLATFHRQREGIQSVQPQRMLLAVQLPRIVFPAELFD